MKPNCKVTYLGHSGFVVSTSSVNIVFDYYNGIESSKVPDLLEDKPTYVFVSHGHYDHFNTDIFDWAAHVKDIVYIFSSDIERKYNAIYMSPLEKRTVDGLFIETLPSTDEGVAFIITVDGITVLHSGDLAWWHWDDESDQDNAAMERDFKSALKPVEGRKIDIAFVLVDPRLDSQRYLTIDYYMSKTDTSHVFPMHFRDDVDFLPEIYTREGSNKYSKSVHLLVKSGDNLDLSL